jgi:hypothetical protein
MEYNRSYNHKTFGAIGSVVFDVPKGSFKLNGQTLPDASVAHLMTFALQTLQDAYAGAKSTDEALGAFNQKLDKLLNGTIGTRGSGDGADERTRVARAIVRGAVKAKFGGKSPEWARFTGLTDDEQAAKLDAWFTANEATFAPAVDEKLAELAAARAKRSELAKDVTFEM